MAEENNLAQFTADNETKKILDRTTNEMTNALINIAIKQFSETDIYNRYFIEESFREEREVPAGISGTPETKTISPSNPVVQEVSQISQDENVFTNW